jgi:hypothetical protein
MTDAGNEGFGRRTFLKTAAAAGAAPLMPGMAGSALFGAVAAAAQAQAAGGDRGEATGRDTERLAASATPSGRSSSAPNCRGAR